MTVRVAIDARMSGGLSGGIEMVVIGLVAGLSRTTDNDLEYSVLSTAGRNDWIRPYISGPVELLELPVASPGALQQGYRLVRRLPLIGERVRAWREARRPLAVSDGAVERLGANVVHFLNQAAFTTKVPSIYHPHDLQHVHLPEYFDEAERSRRDRVYGAYCRQAQIVAVASAWVKADVQAYFGLPADKVRVVPLAPPIVEYQRLDEVDRRHLLQRLHLKPRFLLYPALTWPHKNHAGLLRTLASLRDNGLVVNVVFTGRQTEYHEALRVLERDLRLGDQVAWLDFVSSAELRALYQECVGVIVPTLFEAASFPVLEAFAAGAPLAASSVTSLPEQVGDAGLLFDPADTNAMADAIRRLWTDDGLRRELARRGRSRVEPYTWDNVAHEFQALYREVAKIKR